MLFFCFWLIFGLFALYSRGSAMGYGDLVMVVLISEAPY